MKLIPSLLASLTVLSASATADLSFAPTIQILPTDDSLAIVAKAAHVVPAPRQKAGIDREFIGFIHFGPNTFSRREWGTGFENPADFTPSGLDTDQWVKAMKDAGMSLVILTAKHHDGFVLWQSRYTKHGIMSSPFLEGQADVMRSLAESCRKYGMKLGVYLSPADLYQIENPEGLYGNGSSKTRRTIPRQVEDRPFADTRTFTFDGIDDYNEYFLNQLFELLTEYGPIDEVWFDGAHPKRKGGQTYNNAAWISLIRELAPEAVIFGRADVRWCGNEAGDTRPTEWNIIPYAANPDTLSQFHDMMERDLASREKLMDAKWLHYQYPEVNTSIREGWFYRDDEHQRSRSADDVFDIYERAAGGNAVFLLNVPPNREGHFSQTDVDVLTEVGRRINTTYGKSLLEGAAGALTDGNDSTFTEVDGPIVVAFDKPTRINRVAVSEPIALSGERIEHIALEVFADGLWQHVAEATNVGRKRILRFPTVVADSLRIAITASRLTPSISEISAHFYEAGAPELTVTATPAGVVTIVPRREDFTWLRNADANPLTSLTTDYEIRYTVDGTEPTTQSALYAGPLTFEYPTLIRTAAWANGRRGALTTTQIGYPVSKFSVTDSLTRLFDADPSTAVVIPAEGIIIKANKKLTLNGFAYTPPQNTAEGLIDAGTIYISNNGKKWQPAANFEFGNIINDPSQRLFHLTNPIKAKFIKILPTSTAAHKGTPTAAEIMLF